MPTSQSRSPAASRPACGGSSSPASRRSSSGWALMARSSSVTRPRLYHPRPTADQRCILRGVHATMHGTSSWPRPSSAGRAPRRCSRPSPELARDPWAALVARARLGRRSGRARRPARLGAAAVRDPFVLRRAVELARELLDRGADPNAFFTNEYGRMSALYGAAGRVHDPELARLLLERGANPDDGESLYHATEAPSPDCVRVLLEHGATVEGTNALAHALDEDRLEHVRLLLERRGRGRRATRTSPTPCGAAAGPRCCGCWWSTAPTSTARAARPGARDVPASHPVPARRPARPRRRRGSACRAGRRDRRRPRRRSPSAPSPAASGRPHRCPPTPTSTSRRC